MKGAGFKTMPCHRQGVDGNDDGLSLAQPEIITSSPSTVKRCAKPPTPGPYSAPYRRSGDRRHVRIASFEITAFATRLRFASTP
jgi:hypothetical protein